MKKVLVVVNRFKKGGGISQWVHDYYSELSQKENLSIDFLVEEGISSDNELIFGKDIHIIKIHNLKKNFIRYLLDWKRLANVIDTEYDFVHIHIDNLVRFFNLFFLRNKENIIIHSHSSFNENVQNNFLKRIMHTLGKQIVKRKNFYKFACSDLAAKWLFDDKEYVQINNGVNLREFSFSVDTRNQYIDNFGLKGKTVYGHIGRFTFAKNHERLIEIFDNIHRLNEQSILILVGKGEKETEIRDLVKKYNLNNSVLFLGLRDDVNKIINMIDYFIFPSIYEGLPLALVEAQANGIPVFYSESITKEVSLLPQSTSFSLKDPNDIITDKILAVKKMEDRTAATKILKDKGYEKEDVVDLLYSFYQNF